MWLRCCRICQKPWINSAQKVWVRQATKTLWGEQQRYFLSRLAWALQTMTQVHWGRGTAELMMLQQVHTQLHSHVLTSRHTTTKRHTHRVWNHRPLSHSNAGFHYDILWQCLTTAACEWHWRSQQRATFPKQITVCVCIIVSNMTAHKSNFTLFLCPVGLHPNEPPSVP